MNEVKEKEVDIKDTDNTVDNKKKDDKDKKRNPLFLIIILLILIILLLLMRSCNSLFVPNSDNVSSSRPVFDLTEDGNTQEGNLQGKSKEEIQEELNKQVTNITISMNTNPIFENGESEGNLLIYNDKINTLPQVVEIYLKSDNTLIYKSGLIPVDSRIETAKLSVKLDKGTYDCVAYFNAVNPDTGELLGKAGAEIQITINN